MLSDSPVKRNYKPQKRHKGIAGVGMTYSDHQRIEAIKAFIVTGNMVTVARELNIPYDTLALWKKSNWWKDLYKQIKEENTLKLTARLKNIADKALSATEDRIQNGDYIYDQKTGELRRKPVALREVHRVAVDLTNKAIELEKQPIIEQTQTAILDRLNALKKSFEELGGKKAPVIVTDVIEIPMEPKEPEAEVI